MCRPTWDEYFFNITKVVAERSSCLRRQIGAIAVKNKRILATGYNGAPTGMKHCSELGGCIREKLNIPSGEKQEKCRAIHAEENLIVQAAYYGISLKGCTIYCTNQPCIMCMRKIISLKPELLFYANPYPDKHAMEMLDEMFIQLQNYTNIPGISIWRFK